MFPLGMTSYGISNTGDVHFERFWGPGFVTLLAAREARHPQ